MPSPPASEPRLDRRNRRGRRRGIGGLAEERGSSAAPHPIGGGQEGPRRPAMARPQPTWRGSQGDDRPQIRRRCSFQEPEISASQGGVAEIRAVGRRAPRRLEAEQPGFEGPIGTKSKRCGPNGPDRPQGGCRKRILRKPANRTRQQLSHMDSPPCVSPRRPYLACIYVLPRQPSASRRQPSGLGGFF